MSEFWEPKKVGKVDIKVLLQKCWVGPPNVSRVKVSSDEGFPLYSGEYIIAHHIWCVEAHGLNVPSLLSLPCNQSYRN